ncbi:MAG TPA: 16S rRNA (cytidine(1402)-2'-O)-methyltransferase [Stellaceae bacterium]|nr:16S rRNA (cytidine(1402)-2'-O)-methyltransferase [Stellaceae bacterium]
MGTGTSVPKGNLSPGLHVVATPIGNLGDMTDRARAILSQADLIACEDTRVSLTLLRRFNITTPCAAYHEHNAERMRPRLMAMLAEGKRVALISDAGTPLVSDPGYKLARDVIEAGHRLHAAPGASAVLVALVLSGLPSDRFFFAGFLDAKRLARRRDLETLAVVPASLVFFESAQRLADSLADMAEMLGDRPAAVARELTKLHEEVRRDRLSVLAQHYRQAGPPKGEIVVVVGPPLPKPAPDAADLDAALATALAGMSVRDAAAEVAASLGLNRRTVYARALELARDDDEGEGP